MGHTSELKCSKLLVKRTWDLIAQIVKQRRFVIDSTDSISLNFTTVRFPPWELNISDLNLRLKSEISWNQNRPWTLSFPSNTSPPRTMRTLALLKVFFPRLNRTSIIWCANLHFTVLFQWALHDLVVCPTIDYITWDAVTILFMFLFGCHPQIQGTLRSLVTASLTKGLQRTEPDWLWQSLSTSQGTQNEYIEPIYKNWCFKFGGRGKGFLCTYRRFSIEQKWLPSMGDWLVCWVKKQEYCD